MRYFLLLLCLSLSLNGFPQSLESVLQQYQFTADSLTDSAGEPLTFLLSQTKGDTPLPLLLFCQGSLPKPLLVQTSGGVAGVFPFNHYPHRDQYRFAIISQPGVPLMPAPEELDRSYSYRPEGEYPAAYLRQNTLEMLSNRALQVLNHLRQQAWCSGEVILIGHSQGARVAAEVARQSEAVSHLAYLSTSPFPRQWQVLLTQRSMQDTDSLAHRRVGESQQYYQSIFSPADSLDWTQRSERSFSQSQLPTLLGLDRPLFVGYGTADVGTWLCDFLPIEFARSGKTHLTLRAYPGWEHNFFSTTPEGRADYQAFHWDEVFAEIMDWVSQ